MDYDFKFRSSLIYLPLVCTEYTPQRRLMKSVSQRLAGLRIKSAFLRSSSNNLRVATIRPSESRGVLMCRQIENPPSG